MSRVGQDHHDRFGTEGVEPAPCAECERLQGYLDAALAANTRLREEHEHAEALWKRIAGDIARTYTRAVDRLIARGLLTRAEANRALLASEAR